MGCFTVNGPAATVRTTRAKRSIRYTLRSSTASPARAGRLWLPGVAKAGTKLAIEADNAETVDIMGRRSAAAPRVELSAEPVLVRAEKINATIA